MQTTQTLSTTGGTRMGRFTSSNIAALMTLARDRTGFGKPAFNYIAEKNIERRLGRALDTATDTRATAWGQLMQHRAFALLGAGYWFNSNMVEHPRHGSYWAGSPDLQKFDKGGTVVEIKCPFTLKSFCQLADCRHIDEVREEHPEGETYYWQLVSNAILTNSKYAELVVYMPYKAELPMIRYHADRLRKTTWIATAADDELPWLPDDGYYRNLHIIRFEVDEHDKQELTKKVISAGNLLI